MVDLLKEVQVWKKTDFKEAVEKKMGVDVSDTQFNRVLKELCVSKGRKWILKCFDA